MYLNCNKFDYLYFRDGKEGRAKYANLPSAGVVLNLLGVSIIIFAILVGYLVSRPNYKRKPLPEEQALQLEETSSPIN